MGGMVSSAFVSPKITYLFQSVYSTYNISDETWSAVAALLNELCHYDANSFRWHRLGSHIQSEYLSKIPKNENILSVTSCDGYNLLQYAVALNSHQLVKWLINYGVDLNRGHCSLPLHIAARMGNLQLVEELIQAGARVDLEARMCFPLEGGSSSHASNCELSRRPFTNSPSASIPNGLEGSSKQSTLSGIQSSAAVCDRLKSVEYYAIDSDSVPVLEYVLAMCEDNWLPWQSPSKPLLYSCLERGAWNCVNYLITERSEEVNLCHDEYYPAHQAALQDIRFLEVLIECGVNLHVRSSTQQLTILHVLLLCGRKSAGDTLSTLKLLFDHGCRELINEPDSLGNTPLHAAIVRYSLEEGRVPLVAQSSNNFSAPWTRYDALGLVRFLIQQGVGSESLNRPSNSGLCCVLRHVRDWEFRYELLSMLLEAGADPNGTCRDGSTPLIVCLVPLLNKSFIYDLSPIKRVSYFNCIRVLCKYGADPNCSWRTTLTPLHVLVYAASEYMTIHRAEDKRTAMELVRQVLALLLAHNLDPNVDFSPRNEHILVALLEMVTQARESQDLNYVADLTLTLIQNGADPNLLIANDEPEICVSQSSLFLKKTSNYVLYHYVQNLLRKERTLAANGDGATILNSDARSDSESLPYARLIYLYYNAMSHTDLYACLTRLQKELLSGTLRPPLHRSNSHDGRATSPVMMTTETGHELTSLLRSLTSCPRPLKAIARQAIHASVAGRMAPVINKLGLPPFACLLKDYLLEFQ